MLMVMMVSQLLIGGIVWTGDVLVMVGGFILIKTQNN